MHRIISLIMITALLSVTSLPLIPQAAVCHGTENSADCAICHSQATNTETSPTHAMHTPDTNMQHDMGHNTLQKSAMDHHSPKQDRHNGHDGHIKKSYEHQNIETPKAPHKHQKKLSTAEKECRIECGCGCNRSLDGFPQVLSPHVSSAIHFEADDHRPHSIPENFPTLHALESSVSPPPPKPI